MLNIFASFSFHKHQSVCTLVMVLKNVDKSDLVWGIREEAGKLQVKMAYCCFSSLFLSMLQNEWDLAVF